MKMDRATLGIFANHCRAAAESMAHTLYRTAHSTFVKETEDFTTGLTTPAGATFATPIDLGATWFVALDYGNVIRAIDQYEEGDICITNDPYSGFVCTHPPDLHMWMPVFYAGELICFAVGHVHNTDVGGAVPASLSRSLTEVHQEGIRIPPMKLYARGELNQQLVDILWTNVRVPDQNWGDLKAQIAALKTGARKAEGMAARFGPETFKAGIEAVLDYAHAQAKRVVSGLPDGEYFFADYIDEDAVNGQPCRIALNVVIEGDEVTFDFTGTDPQLESSINMPTGGDPRHVLLLVGLVYVLYSLDRSILLNAGLARVAHCILPPGTMVNPEFPAAVGMRSLSCMRLQGITIGAFAQAAPDLLPAGPASGGPIMNVNTVDNRTGRRVVASIAPISGGAGGSALGDGTEGSGANSSFLKNTPVEINETEVPIRILRYGLAPDSGAPGKHRGGLATELEFEVFSPNTRITARNRDRTRFTAWGLAGGQAGSASRFTLNRGSKTEVDLGNTDIVTVGPGDRIYISCGGAGGWGDPLERRAELVARDVRRGFVSEASARDNYGVVIEEGQLDEHATARGRASRARPATNALYSHGDERRQFESVWNRDRYAELTAILARVPVHWRFFVKHRLFELTGRDTADSRTLAKSFRSLLERYPQLQAAMSESSSDERL
ncbi:MAG: hydantoinase B/oxoprolinase family protein [Pseudomonadota bacterium]